MIRQARALIFKATLMGVVKKSPEDCLRQLPTKTKYQVIMADPPWSYSQAGGAQGTAAAQYPTMSLQALKDLPVKALATDPCVLFMWATCPLLPEALELMAAWGFEYKTVFQTWVKTYANGKPVLGLGHWARSCTELVLVGTRGSGYLNWRTTRSQSQLHTSTPAGHSTKPQAVRDIIRDFLKVPRRIELFARSRSPGFDAWGLDLPGYFQLDPARQPRVAQHAPRK